MYKDLQFRHIHENCRCQGADLHGFPWHGFSLCFLASQLVHEVVGACMQTISPVL